MSAPALSPPKLAYSIDEAVVASGLSRSFLYEAIKDGRLAAIKAGSRTLVTTDGLRAFLSSLPAMHPEKQKTRAT